MPMMSAVTPAPAYAHLDVYQGSSLRTTVRGGPTGVSARGANRTVTLDTPIVLTTGTVRAYTVTSGQRGFLGLRYSLNLGAWILLAQTQTIAG